MLQASNNSIIRLIKIFLFPLFIILFSQCSNNQKDTSRESTIFQVDMEHFSNDTITDTKSKYHFTGFQYLTKKEKHSGIYSLLLDSTAEFALTTELKLKRNDYNLSFWEKGNTKVIAVVQDLENKNFYLASKAVIKKDSTGWQKVLLSFNIPNSVSGQKFRIYVWNQQKAKVYIDDFELKKITPLDFSDIDTILYFYINNKNYKKIQDFRKQALKKGILITTDNSWIKAIMFVADKYVKVKMRLKGDWTDHLQGEKWSFRIKIKSKNSFRRLKTFSIQNPATRSFIDEWLIHKIFIDEGILSTRYGFVPVVINDTNKGLYAYEEHFLKQLVESQKRREGPILKFEDFAYWYQVLMYKNEKTDKYYPIYGASVIVPFKQNKTIKDSLLYTEFNIAKNLLFQHKYFLAKPSEIFDIDKLAKYFAMVNVQRLYHSSLWINQRFYYNPITSKLEPIAYDCYTEDRPFDNVHRPIFGNFNIKNPRYFPPSGKIKYYLFTDTAFVNRYIKYLKIFSQKSYWDKIFKKYNKQLKYFEKLLQREYPYYKFSRQFFYDNAALVNNALPGYIQKVKNGLYKNFNLKYNINLKTKTPDSITAASLVKVYTQGKSDYQTRLRILNYNPVKIKIIGYYSDGIKEFLTNESITAFDKNTPGTKDIFISADKKIDSIEISVEGLRGNFSVPVLPWSEPVAWSPRQELEKNNLFPDEKFYTVKNNEVIFSGPQTINKIILIPAGYKVIFNAGTKIDFVNGGGFLSYSPVYIDGTEQKPVIIKSSDSSARGFTVLQGGEVIFNYAIFDGLNTFSYKGWQLTGAVTLYETNVKITNSKFINNHCEDDLNTVRCYVVVKNTTFENTFSDGFDSDFSNGKVDNCYFKNLGNDAIDFSTSKIDISNCTIINASDKGVSGGEASRLTLHNCTIDGANIGIASKDLSVVEADNCTVKNTTYALTAFRKKPEYGEAKIIVNNLKASDYVQLSLIEKKSVLIMDNLTIEGKYKNIAKKFY